MQTSEVEFLSEKEYVRIEPKFSADTLCLIEGDVGPFSARIPREVPLWLAVNLKQKHKCRVFAPDWMSIEALEERKQEEANSAQWCTPPSPHYHEVAKTLLRFASDDIPESDTVRALVKDIWDLRLKKLHASVAQFMSSGATHAKLNQLTQMEINTMRGLLTAALHELTLLQKATDGSASLSSQFTSQNHSQ